jgi:DNA topoisomerase-1
VKRRAGEASLSERRSEVGAKRRPRAPKSVASARAARLHYSTDTKPGIRRVKNGKRFRFLRPDGKPLTARKDLERIRALAIPPAWTNVWISPDPLGHLQATGRDARGRKQYRYHARWREVRDDTKYGRMLEFGRALPAIRRRIEADLRRNGLQRRKVLATIVRLLEKTLIRVGNEEYARDNRSFGLTTMRDGHVKVNGSKVAFVFRGKSGIKRELELSDRTLAPIVKKCRDLPGQELFQYRDQDGEIVDIGSGDVNAYLKEISGEDFTSKDFRTWCGTVYALELLLKCEAAQSESKAKKIINRCIEEVAGQLGNTKAVCRKSYVHPAVIDAYLDGSIAKRAGRAVKAIGRLTRAEAAVLGLLQRQKNVTARSA